MAEYQKTQQSIMRQSQIKNVIEYCNIINKPLTLKEIIGITNVLVDYCENGYTKEVGDRLSKIDDHIKSLSKETV